MHGFPELSRLLQDVAIAADATRVGRIVTRAVRHWEMDALLGQPLQSPRWYVTRELLHDLSISSRTIDAFTATLRYGCGAGVAGADRFGTEASTRVA